MTLSNIEKKFKHLLTKYVSGHVHTHIFKTFFDNNKNMFDQNTMDYIFSGYIQTKNNQDYFHVMKNPILFENYFKEENSFKSFEHFNDDVSKALFKREADIIVSRAFSLKHRKMLDDECLDVIRDLTDLGQTLELFKKGFSKKIALIENEETMKKELCEYLESLISWDKQYILNKIKKHQLIEGEDFEFEHENIEHFFIRILSYKASYVLGSRMWCISRSENAFDHYVCDPYENGIKFSSFLFAFNFNKPYSHEESQTAILLDINNKASCSYDRFDDESCFHKNNKRRMDVFLKNHEKDTLEQFINRFDKCAKLAVKCEKNQFSFYDYDHIASLICYYQNALQPLNFHFSNKRDIPDFILEKEEWSAIDLLMTVAEFNDETFEYNQLESLNWLLPVMNKSDNSEFTLIELYRHPVFKDKNIKIVSSFIQRIFISEQYDDIFEIIDGIDTIDSCSDLALLNNFTFLFSYNKIDFLNKVISCLAEKTTDSVLQNFIQRKYFNHDFNEFNLFYENPVYKKAFENYKPVPFFEYLKNERIVFQKNCDNLKIVEDFSTENKVLFNSLFDLSNVNDVFCFLYLSIPFNPKVNKFIDSFERQNHSFFSNGLLSSHMLVIGTTGQGRSFFNAISLNEKHLNNVNFLKLTYGDSLIEEAFNKIVNEKDFYVDFLRQNVYAYQTECQESLSILLEILGEQFDFDKLSDAVHSFKSKHGSSEQSFESIDEFIKKHEKVIL